MFILIGCLSCQTRKDYEDMAIKIREQLNCSECKNDFWNIEVMPRGKKTYFFDNNKHITTILSDSTFVVDTIIYEKRDFLPFTGLKDIKIEQMEKIAHCLKEVNIRKIRGFDTDSLKYLECIVNDHLTLYYVPEMQKNSFSKQNWFINNTLRISENYYYYIKK
jgi:hypothetical protein